MKLKSTEVRLGNWVNFKYNGTDYGDVRICSNFFRHYSDKKEIITPIKLTEEWLVKLGFKFKTKLFDSKIYFKGIYFVSILEDSITFGMKEKNSAPYTPLVRTPNFYIHQLQNLYFVLTGKELEL